MRVNQVGYISGKSKVAVLLATGSEAHGSFSVVNARTGAKLYSAPLGAGTGGWNPAFPYTYALAFSSMKAGQYYIQVDGPIPARSPVFTVDTGANLYTRLLANALFFYQAQRDGRNVDSRVMSRRPSHLTDQSASVYATPTYTDGALAQAILTRVGGPIDVSGGWFDAGDYLKLVETASYTDAVMLLAVRQYPGLLARSPADFATEGRYGLDWLQKMWDSKNKILYYQVGIGDGNGDNILGDHDFWRLPQVDDGLPIDPGQRDDPAYYVKYRPVFRVSPPGSPISPNLAGRVSADLGLCFQLYHQSNPAYANRCLASAETIFDLAKVTVGDPTCSSASGAYGNGYVTTTPCDYYPESEWRDDMELGAAELYLATALGALPRALPHTDPMYYSKLATYWARAYITNEAIADSDTLNLYDVAGLAHYELYRALVQARAPAGLYVTKADLLGNLSALLTVVRARATKDPFGLGLQYDSGLDLVPHALGLALMAGFYDDLAGTTTYDAFAQTEFNWVLGINAWGSSFTVGAGTTFPHCLQHQVANLVGRLDGTPPILLGATVDGPSVRANFSGLSLQSGMKPCPAPAGDAFAAFTGRGARYWDNVIAHPSVEPADDYTALTILLFARQIDRPARTQANRWRTAGTQ